MPTATLVSVGNREHNNEWGIFNWRSKMVPFKITTQRVSRWFQMSLFTLALFVVPMGFTFAQDYDAVIKRLRQAVEAKEISPEQAKRMIAALKISSAKQAPTGKPTVKKDVSKAKIDWEAAKNKIEGAVKEGKLTRQQADAHYLALKKQTAQKPAVKKADSKPKSAVPAKPAVKKDASKAKIDWEAIKHRIESGVKAGKLTREQADAMYLELKKQYRPKPDTSSKPDVKKDNQPDPRIAFEQVAKEIRAAVEAGKITAEQGRARLAAYRKHLAERQEKEAPKDVKSAPQEQRRIQEIKIRNVNGVKNIYVTENDRKITIIDDPDRGIKIEITDNKDGKPATRTFQANNIEELQKKSPEAYKLYQKYSKYAPSGK
jgi:polyhydroxyalkanoate synthesis regulator phasin